MMKLIVRAIFLTTVLFGWATGARGTCVSVPTTINSGGAAVAAPVVANIDSLSVGNNSYVTSSSGTLTTSGNGASMTTTLGVSPLGQSTLPGFSPAVFPAVGGADNTLSDGTLAAGSYGKVTVNGSSTFSGGSYYISELLSAGNGDTLIMSAGDYFVDKWNVGNNFVLNVSSGPVRIFINTSFQAGNQSFFNSPGTTANLQVYAYSNAQLTFGNANNGDSDVDFNGLIYAPGSNTKIEFGNNNIIQGAVLSGGAVQLGNNTGIIFDAATQSAIASISLPGSGSCNVFDHLQIEHDGEGATCAAENLTIKACADIACSSLATVGGITATLQPFGIAISIGGTGLLNQSVTSLGVGTNTLNATSISPAPANAIPVSCLNTVTHSASCDMLISACPGGANFDCVETAIAPYGGGSARLYTKLAGTPFSFDVVALNASGAVESNYVVAGGTPKNVTVELVDGSGATACASRAAISPAVAQMLTVGSADSGRKPAVAMTVSQAYPDVRCRVTDANQTPSIVGCSSDNFAVRPGAAILMTTASAAAPSAISAPVIKAGTAFTIGATTTTGAADAYTGTLALDSGKLSAQLPTNSLSLQSGGAVGSLTVSPAVQANASPSQSNNAVWDEAGYLYAGAGAFRDDGFTLVDRGAGDCVLSTVNDAYLADTFDANNKIGCSIANKTAVSFGRFIPDHFGISGSVVTRSDLQTTELQTTPFTYMDEPMKFVLAVTAYNHGNGITQNYAASFAKLDVVNLGSTNLSNWICTSGNQCMGLSAISGATSLTSRLALDTTSANSTAPSNTTTAGGGIPGWSGGRSYFTLYAAVGRNISPDGPYDAPGLKFGAKPLDSDGVTLPPKSSTDTAHCVDLNVATGVENAGCVFAAAVPESDLRRKIFETSVRYGRLSLSNAFGSELLDLPMPLIAEYWNNNSWIKNVDDQSTTGISLVATDPIADDGLVPAELFVWDTGIGNGNSGLGYSVAGTSANKFREPPLAGDFNLNFRAPGSGNSGTLDITATVPNYLRFNWKGVGDVNPAARATFGIYKGSSKFIYIRELY
ncbi:DUF6701 domain-containing protein [Candidatus Methylobacter oryzae]|nr:DUF6701 domain-containing protein [Candidatus Methylobacter oryzae]